MTSRDPAPRGLLAALKMYPLASERYMLANGQPLAHKNLEQLAAQGDQPDKSMALEDLWHGLCDEYYRKSALAFSQSADSRLDLKKLTKSGLVTPALSAILGISSGQRLAGTHCVYLVYSDDKYGGRAKIASTIQILIAEGATDISIRISPTDDTSVHDIISLISHARQVATESKTRATIAFVISTSNTIILDNLAHLKGYLDRGIQLKFGTPGGGGHIITRLVVILEQEHRMIDHPNSGGPIRHYIKELLSLILSQGAVYIVKDARSLLKEAKASKALRDTISMNSDGVWGGVGKGGDSIGVEPIIHDVTMMYPVMSRAPDYPALLITDTKGAYPVLGSPNGCLSYSVTSHWRLDMAPAESALRLSYASRMTKLVTNYNFMIMKELFPEATAIKGYGATCIFGGAGGNENVPWTTYIDPLQWRRKIHDNIEPLVSDANHRYPGVDFKPLESTDLGRLWQVAPGLQTPCYTLEICPDDMPCRTSYKFGNRNFDTYGAFMRDYTLIIAKLKETKQKTLIEMQMSEREELSRVFHAAPNSSLYLYSRAILDYTENLLRDMPQFKSVILANPQQFVNDTVETIFFNVSTPDNFPHILGQFIPGSVVGVPTINIVDPPQTIENLKGKSGVSATPTAAAATAALDKTNDEEDVEEGGDEKTRKTKKIFLKSLKNHKHTVKSSVHVLRKFLETLTTISAASYPLISLALRPLPALMERQADKFMANIK
jgi:hypothetical protein